MSTGTDPQPQVTATDLPLTLRLNLVASALGVTRRTLDTKLKNGDIKLPVRNMGGTRVVLRDDLLAYLAALPLA